jgi:hypothetical protein
VTSFAETHVVDKTEKSSFYPKAVQPIIHGEYASHNTVLFPEETFKMKVI